MSTAPTGGAPRRRARAHTTTRGTVVNAAAVSLKALRVASYPKGSKANRLWNAGE
jgi:hypothetical protein